MLVLSRKAQEKIVINNNITVTVLSVRGHVVRLGLNAPPDVPVFRFEVYQRIREEGSAFESAEKAESSGMLVLSRKRGEAIEIGGDIHIVVVEFRGDKVRLGITAPTEIPVHRGEAQEKIDRDYARAANHPPVRKA